MAKISLPTAAGAVTHQYHLAESDRQQILAQNESSRMNMKIARQRQEFIQKFGDAFGQIIENQYK